MKEVKWRMCSSICVVYCTVSRSAGTKSWFSNAFGKKVGPASSSAVPNFLRMYAADAVKTTRLARWLAGSLVQQFRRFVPALWQRGSWRLSSVVVGNIVLPSEHHDCRG